MPLITRADGRTSAYGFACGYQDIHDTGTIRVRMYMEHGCYHIRSFQHVSPRTLIAWESTTELRRARQTFNRYVREAKNADVIRA